MKASYIGSCTKANVQSKQSSYTDSAIEVTSAVVPPSNWIGFSVGTYHIDNVMTTSNGNCSGMGRMRHEAILPYISAGIDKSVSCSTSGRVCGLGESYDRGKGGKIELSCPNYAGFVAGSPAPSSTSM